MSNHYHYHQYHSAKEMQEQFKKNPGLFPVTMFILLFPFCLPAFFFACFLVYQALGPAIDPYYNSREHAMNLDVSEETYIEHVDCLQELKRNKDENTVVCNIPADAPPYPYPKY